MLILGICVLLGAVIVVAAGGKVPVLPW